MAENERMLITRSVQMELKPTRMSPNDHINTASIECSDEFLTVSYKYGNQHGTIRFVQHLCYG